MSRISTIILISLILSCIDNIICEQNISYKFQYKNVSTLDPIFHTPLDIDSIVQSSKPMFIDISIIVTKNACTYCGSRLPNVTQYFELLFRTASKIFALHRITLSVVQQEFWCRKNKVTASDELNTLSYQNYFSSISPRPDALFVLEDVIHPHYAGAAEVGKVCTPHGIAIVDLCRKSKLNPKRTGETLAHELGHILGLKDIEKSAKNCKCGTPGQNFCVMYWREEPWHGNYSRSFTDCEMENIKKKLKNYPCMSTKYKAPRLWGTCGDGVVGEGEDCDSGFLDKSKKLFSENECCDPKTCKYRQKGYNCWYGECCKKCKITSANVCRKSVAECDHLEVCDGINPECPKDRYKNNFEMCNYRQGFCYLKSCINMDVMCRVGYKKKEVFFSISCAKALGNIMKNKCPTPSNITEFNRIVCRRKVPCEHFVCAMPRGVYVKGALYFESSKRDELCLIPKKNNRYGLTSQASMYMNCGFHSKYPKFCHNKECTNSSRVLKNCNIDTCRNMNVKFRSQIDPDSGISPFLNTGNFIFFTENEKDQFLQQYSNATISFIISIPVIFLLSFLILLKKNWLNFDKQTD